MPERKTQLGARGPRRPLRVAVLGGGVGGLTAAHELVERGCEVVVFEAEGRYGGKARSYPVLGTGRDGRTDLPGEHGHRMFPGFYTHLDDTMRRIPFGGQPGGVFDNLVPTTAGLFLSEGRPPMELPAHFPRRAVDVAPYMRRWLGQFRSSGLNASEIATFVQRSLRLLTCSDARLLDQYERVSWQAFMTDGDGQESPSSRFDELFLGGWSQTFAALDARHASARTMGTTLAQMFLWSQFPGTRRTAVRVLDGPTSEVFIDPWVAHLRHRGVRFVRGARVERFEVAGGRIQSVRVRHAATPNTASRVQHVTADAFVSALPVEVMRRVADAPLIAAAPSLGGLHNLHVRFMGGVQLYLDRPLPLVRGHVHYGRAPWALTSVSQRQFWPDYPLHEQGDGTVREIVSVSVADWETPGRFVTDKPAVECEAEVIVREVHQQIRAHLGPRRRAAFDAARLVDGRIDERIRDIDARAARSEPLMVNTVDSWRHRPEAATEIENLVLASDYVRTNMDFASMEAANEAARRGVNALLDRFGVAAAPCGLWPLTPPRVLEPLRKLDALRTRWRKSA